MARRPCLARGETSRPDPIAFRLLGPVQAEAGGRTLPLGGPKQRAVLAVLLLGADEIVPLERLVDSLWGDDPPSSAAHAVETYISRLRAVLEPYGVELLRSGRGYRLSLGSAVLDSSWCEALLGDAARAAEDGDDTRALDLADRALDLWRGPALVDTPLSLAGRGEVERLEELRLRAHEQRGAALLALGRHHELVGRLRPLVEEHPLRDGFVAPLMIALYRSGRQAEALEAYDEVRRAHGELGLHPSRELQELSGRIVRQAEQLGPPPARERRPRRGVTRRLVGAALAVVGAAAATVALAATVRSDDPQPQLADAGARVALLLPRAPVAGREDPYVAQVVDGLRRAASRYGVQTETLVGDELHPEAAANGRLVERVRNADFDLVILSTPTIGGDALVRLTRRLPNTRFVFIDAYLEDSPLAGQANLTAVKFGDEQAGYLAGYLSALVVARATPADAKHVISAVGGFRTPQVKALVDGFGRGARAAVPSITVLKGYSRDFVRQAPCEAIASRQIDAGSEIVFAPAGRCGLGALAAAGLRGAYGVAADQDRAYLGSHILASAVKRFDRAVVAAVRWYLEGTLPPGKDVTFALAEDGVALAGIDPRVPESVRRRIAEVEAQLRQRRDGRAP
jgi:basic membrane lipoprotein Med (substrate-binding protein (PBP1-ABC) superfamily)/DNA-binding SARP family transcriptional activator